MAEEITKNNTPTPDVAKAKEQLSGFVDQMYAGMDGIFGGYMTSIRADILNKMNTKINDTVGNINNSVANQLITLKQALEEKLNASIDVLKKSVTEDVGIKDTEVKKELTTHVTNTVKVTQENITAKINGRIEALKTELKKDIDAINKEVSEKVVIDIGALKSRLTNVEAIEDRINEVLQSADIEINAKLVFPALSGKISKEVTTTTETTIKK